MEHWWREFDTVGVFGVENLVLECCIHKVIINNIVKMVPRKLKKEIAL